MININNIDLYDMKGFKFNVGDKVRWNKEIFWQCPFKVDEIKKIDEIKYHHIGLKGMRVWWNWWEIVPVNIFRKIPYYIKFYYWYYTRFKKL